MSISHKLGVALNHPTRAVASARVRLRNRKVKGTQDPNSTTFARDARPGPVAQVFAEVRSIPGWFTYDDAAHFTLALNLQSASGLRGDILEIGSFHGRSAAVLARGLRQGERLTVVDPFQIGEVYVGNPPSPERVRDNVLTVARELDPEALEIIAAYSTDLDLDEDRRFRFIHIDGSHERPDVFHDLTLADQHLLAGGIIVCDDYQHPDWPGVTEAIHDFRSGHSEYVEVADVNRHAESGRKLYLSR